MTNLQPFTIPTDGSFKADALQAMDIMYRVEQEIAGNENLIALSIKTAIENNGSFRKHYQDASGNGCG